MNQLPDVLQPGAVLFVSNDPINPQVTQNAENFNVDPTGGLVNLCWPLLMANSDYELRAALNPGGICLLGHLALRFLSSNDGMDLGQIDFGYAGVWFDGPMSITLPPYDKFRVNDINPAFTSFLIFIRAKRLPVGANLKINAPEGLTTVDNGKFFDFDGDFLILMQDGINYNWNPIVKF